MTSRDISISIAREHRGTAPSGRVLDAGGNELPFAGWLALVALLEQMLDAEPADSTPGVHSRA